MKYKSNAHDVINNIKSKILGGKSIDNLCLSIAQVVYANNLQRVFVDGQDIKGHTIGQYSRKPMYVNQNKSTSKFAKIGKTGKKKFKNGKNHQTRYFKNGYFEFRNLIKKGTKVNLNLTGSLKGNFRIEKQRNRYLIGFMSGEKGKIASHLEKHFGKKVIWGYSKKDHFDVQKVIKNWVKDAKSK
jgi:tetrahydromethanopterin S-methyltransferase subunit A